ncbi:MAG: hypothetical protein HFJ87_05135 [Muribaculaceae bacterium]|nr:hypothetical protein [Muribaculaceae bacterium]MCI9054512.1 hypothetical protein [Muribaculaceae bacterium]
MKKVLAILLAVLFILPAAYAADPAKQLKKAKEKERKEVMKRLKKEQWSLLGSSRSLEVALLSHWTELDALGADGKEIVGISTRTKSKNIGQQMATNAACINYAQEAGSAVKGRALTDMAGSGVDTDKEFENFYAAYERLVEKEIRGEMKQSFSLIRTNADGTFEVQSFYIISEDAASKARIRAFENATKESEAAQKHADKISEFVRAGFDQ